MNKVTESQRLNLIRGRLTVEVQRGMAGVVAARARVPEFILVNWVKDPLDMPTRKEIVDIQVALEPKESDK